MCVGGKQSIPRINNVEEFAALIKSSLVVTFPESLLAVAEGYDDDIDTQHPL